MKKILIILLFIGLVWGQSNDNLINKYNLIEHYDGLVYEPNDGKPLPFTGTAFFLYDNNQKMEEETKIGGCTDIDSHIYNPLADFEVFH